MTAQDRCILRAPFRVNTVYPVYRHAGRGVSTVTEHGFVERAYSNRWGLEIAVRASLSYPPIIEWEGDYDR